MEAVISPSSLLPLSNSRRPHLLRRISASSATPPLTPPPTQLRFTAALSKPAPFASLTFSTAAAAPVRCFSSSAASGGGNDGGATGGGGGGGGGGGNGSEGGDSKVAEVVRANDDVSALSADVIVLQVGGMSCGGCANKVKRILESQPLVSSANVILATETAIVWPVADAKVSPNWREELGETLAKHLTSCGFQSELRGQEENVEQVPQ